MKKIISLFQRNYDGDHLVRDEVVPGAEWVLNGEGVATRKYDGTCCLIKDGFLYKRYEAKKEPPEGFIPAQDRDAVTGHWVGWLLCRRDDPADKYHWEAIDNDPKLRLLDGTYELIGPKVQGNPEGLAKHILQPHHYAERYHDCPRTFNEIKEWLRGRDIEGVVFHHPDGRMVKIKAKDFGLRRTEVSQDGH